MKRGITSAVIVACIGLIAFGTPAPAVQKEGETGNGQPSALTVKGEVLKHEGDTLTMKSAGKEIHLHIGKDTVIPGLEGAKFIPGDKIVAEVTTDGHAKSVRPAP
ncbi:MAG: hypothetical protein ACREJU_11520 [Nitrospiraceae bacterium]